MMRRALLFLFLFFFLLEPALAQRNVTMYLFWGDGCHYCADEKEFLERIKPDYPELEVKSFEVWYNPGNARLLAEMAKAYSFNPTGVPVTFIGDFVLSGFSAEQLVNKIEYCISYGCEDPYTIMGGNGVERENSSFEGTVSPLKAVSVNVFVDDDCESCEGVLEFAGELSDKYNVKVNVYDIRDKAKEKIYKVFKETYSVLDAGFPVVFIGERFLLGRKAVFENLEPEIMRCSETGCPIPEEKIKGLLPYIPRGDFKLEADSIVELPIFGTVDVSKVGLFTFSVMIGMLDGFNACAMWVLCFLLTLLVYSGSRKRIFLIGGVFIFVSGTIYFMFIAAWFNLFLFVGYLKLLQIGIGAMAIVFGVINVKDFFWFGKGPTLTIASEKKKRIIEKMRKVLSPEFSLPATLAGVAFLAFGVNIIELLCTVGFPAIYTSILSAQNISTFSFYFYLSVYIFFYMLDDLIIFSVVVLTMSSKRFTEKYGRISKLVSGLVILVLGVVMILKPELLMFG